MTGRGRRRLPGHPHGDGARLLRQSGGYSVPLADDEPTRIDPVAPLSSAAGANETRR